MPLACSSKLKQALQPWWPSLSLCQACILFKARLFSIAGRSSRAEYWWISLIEFGLWLGAMYFLDWFWEHAGYNALVSEDTQRWWELVLFKQKITLFITMALPVLGSTLTIRRLHDRGHTGWWILLYLLPLGWFVLSFIALLPGDPQTNRYGLSPQAQIQQHYSHYSLNPWQTRHPEL